MKRVAVAGFQHETNSFAPVKASWDDFVKADAWPGLLRGRDILSSLKGTNIPAAGFIERAHIMGWETVPLLWCSAGPSGPVTIDAYQRITDEICQCLSDNLPIDALYLDLHGAMIAEDYDDADGAFLLRLRQLLGPDTPIVASLDMHANLSQAMAENTEALVIYRHYPHTDMSETGMRSANRLQAILKGNKSYTAFRQLDFLIPLVCQSTLDPAMAGTQEIIAAQRSNNNCEIEFASGFPLADVKKNAPGILVYAGTHEQANAAADQVKRLIEARESLFRLACLDTNTAVSHAQAAAVGASGPVLLIDTQDNPGGGGSGKSVGLLSALVQASAQNAVFGVLYDPAAARMAHDAGLGAKIITTLGEQQGPEDTPPTPATYAVTALGNGIFTGTGPFYRGCHFNLGPMAVLDTGSIRVVVASARQQAADQAMFRHVGIAPETASVLAVKSSIHYRADFDEMSAATIIVAAPGYNVADLRKLPFRNLAPNMRIAGE